MSYNARVYQVFIASPADVSDEREVVRRVIERWNAVNSEKTGVVLLPVSWETHAAPEYGRPAQQIINETVLEQCDMLIALFWTRIGSKTNAFDSGTIEEIERHVAERKLAMIYFSTKDLPSNCDIDQVKRFASLKKKCNVSIKDFMENSKARKICQTSYMIIFKLRSLKANFARHSIPISYLQYQMILE